MRALPLVLRRLWWSRASAAAVEFAVIVPVMIIFFFGMIELFNVIRAQAKLNVATGQFAQMVAGQNAVTEGSATGAGGTLGDMCTGSSFNLAPFNPAYLSAYVGSITIVNLLPVNDWVDDDACPATIPQIGGPNTEYVILFYDSNQPRSLYTQDGNPATGNGFNTENGNNGYSAIVVATNYVYHNVLPYALAATITLTATSAARPRSDTTVPCTYGTGAATHACTHG